MGVSSVTGPTPNKGFEAAAMQKLGSITNQLAEIIPLAGPLSDMGKLAIEMLQKITKLVPPGGNSPASEQNNLKQALIQSQQNMSQMQQMRPQASPAASPPGGPPRMPGLPAAPGASAG
jgi:hypothetical protein